MQTDRRSHRRRRCGEKSEAERKHQRLTKIKEAFFPSKNRKVESEWETEAVRKRLLSGSETLFGGSLAVTQRGPQPPAGGGEVGGGGEEIRLLLIGCQSPACHPDRG